MKKNISNIFYMAIITLLLGSCNAGVSGTWENERIDRNIRSEVDTLNKKLFRSIISKDEAGVKQLLSPVLLKNAGSKLDTIMGGITEDLKTADYHILDDFYIKNSNTNISNTLFSLRGDHNDYSIQYLALNQEMFVSTIVSKNLPSNFLILAIYGKYDNKWLLNILQIGQYSLLDKTGPDYYADALKQYNGGNFVDAVDLVVTVSGLASPGGQHFKYKNNDEMESFYKKALKEANTKYQFPMNVPQLKTNPQIFSIRPQVITNGDDKGIFPVIGYKSSIKLTDTIALKAENKELQKVIENIFKGITKNKTGIIYQAVNQFPDGKTRINHYGFIQHLK